MKILIGYDGSEYGEIILEDLTQAGLPENTEAVVLTIADVRGFPISPVTAERISQIENLFNLPDTDINSSLDKYKKDARNDGDKFVSRIKEVFPGWRVSSEAVLGKPARELLTMGHDIDPDILVVGSHGRTAVGRFFLGSVSHEILHEADSSVRISRKRNSNDHGNRVLLAVDGSKNSEAVVQTAAERVWTKATEICLVAVDDPFTRPEVGYVKWDHTEDKPVESEKAMHWIETVINKPKQILESVGLQVSHKILWGDAANMILQEAKDWNADCIFLGAKGVSRVKRFWLGSVSSRVATHAECSVEIVKI
jgi:nucleotide-binding universal stress UspA family protein